MTCLKIAFVIAALSVTIMSAAAATALLSDDQKFGEEQIRSMLRDRPLMSALFYALTYVYAK